MSALHAKPVSVDLVSAAAREALDGASGSVRDATLALERRVNGDPDLFQALMAPLLAEACYSAVRRESQRDRRTAWKAPVERLRPSPSGVTGAHRVVALAAGTLLMFPLPGGRKLGEATREEIAEAADFYGTQAADMTVKSRFLRLVAQSVPGGQTAGSVLSEGRLRELQEEARRG